MSFTHILRVLFAVAISGAAGWVFLAGYHILRILQQFEAFEAGAPDGNLDGLPRAMLEAMSNIEGGGALFLGAGIAGVLLGEVIKTRSLLFYSAATGALTAALAATLWQQGHVPGNARTAAALAMAGFVAGAIYWMIAGYSEARR